MCEFSRRILVWLLAGALTASAASSRAQTAGDGARDETAIRGLEAYQNLVGKWRGIGQPKRGSAAGAWQEQAEVVWEHKAGQSGLRVTVRDGKLWKSYWLSFAAGEQPFVVQTTAGDDTLRKHVGKREGQRLVLESSAEDAAEVERLTLLQLDENRWTLLVEKRGAQQSFYQRVAEVAYQREGTRLATRDGSGPECVVTGGLGTIAVSYQGQTYYVCCTGCRDAFNDDPAGILAAYAERKKQTKKP